MSRRATAVPTPSFEKTLPWEHAVGATPLDRTVKVGKDRQLFFERHNERPSAIHVDHIQDVGHAALHLAHRVDSVKAVNKTPSSIIIIPDNDSDSASDEEFESKMHQDDLDRILMAEEWDTRFWNRIKIHEAINTLYAEIEKSPDVARRRLAHKMLLHLNTLHKEAYMTNENNLCTLSNKAFRKLTVQTKNDAIYNIAELLAVFAGPFAAALAHENAVLRSLTVLLRQMDCAARVLQHFRRRRQFERQLRTQDISVEARMRMRAINAAKCIELSRQQRCIHDALGHAPMPERAVVAYMTIITTLVQDELRMAHGFSRHDRAKIIPAGGLVWLNQCVKQHHSPTLVSLTTQLLTVLAHDTDRIADILRSNVVVHVATNLIHATNDSDKAMAIAFLDRVAYTVCQVVEQQRTGDSSDASDVSGPVMSTKSFHSLTRSLSTKSTRSNANGSPSRRRNTAADDDERDAAYRNRHLSAIVLEQFTTPAILGMLLQALDATVSSSSWALTTSLLQVLHKIAYDVGYVLLLDLVTRNAGRHVATIVKCLDDAGGTTEVVLAALQVLMVLAAREEGRDMLTLVGLVQMVHPLCAPGFRAPNNSYRFVVGLLPIVLCANPVNSLLAFGISTPRNAKTGAFVPMTLLVTPQALLDHVHACLLHCCTTDTSGHSAQYFLKTNALTLVLDLLVQPAGATVQTRSQRHISAIVLSNFCRVAKVASMLAFRQDIATHLAVVVQSNRMEESEAGGCEKFGPVGHQRHLQSTAEACRAFLRMLRCQRQTLQPRSIVLATQVFFLRTLLKLHALEDIVESCRPVNTVSDFVADDIEVVKCAVQLVGQLFPSLSLLELQTWPASSSVQGVILEASGIADLASRLVAMATPALLHTLAADDPLPRVVKWCCGTLAQLCSTNVTCVHVLQARCLDVVASFVPNVPSDTMTPAPHVVSLCESADDDKLASLPPTFYTLLAMLCRLADGRAAIYRLNILPRILKRLHFASSAKGLTLHDHQCRSEIAQLVAAIANENMIVVGNVNELCLRHHVHTILVQMLHPSLPSNMPQALGPALQESALAALSAMSKDHVRIVPALMAVGVLPHILSFLARWDDDPSVSMAMLDGAVLVMWGMAQSSSESIQAAIKASKVSEHLLRIGCSFRLEMLKVAIFGEKSIGEVARETLRHLSEFHAKRSSTASNNNASLPPSPTSRQPSAATSPSRRPASTNASGTPESNIILPSLEASQPPPCPPLKSPTTSNLPTLDWRSTRPLGPKPKAQPMTVQFIRPKPKPMDERKKYPLLMLDPVFGALDLGVDPCTAVAASPSRDNSHPASTAYVGHVSSIMGHHVIVRVQSPSSPEVDVVPKALGGSSSTGALNTSSQRKRLG
ncbi:hypothetical protein H310_05529 [Aphanomyces invadans]|uniref:Uncharacterized protein n=1 Tax=Aphanomyces invadans TaxID=157072 RepID=A0A024UBT9_9STRA|nr:hypothetical protein H310_05529 [Aphanomyces invadans]ETW03103.1 hypothetical protein H310_05529 [Aphanomyces invadans]|eukprot:XP_008868487.1 hypothetical protein H310_05529 [Aphanomyces invadans]